MRKTRSKKNSFNWNKVQRFSIRKLSFGVASCMIGAHFVLSGLNHIAKADGITAYEANGDKVTAYAHGESVYKLRGTSTSIYNAFLMNVDTSEYTKENPIIKVTLTYNAKENEAGEAPIFWSGRPFHWFTVPEGTEELGNDYKLKLTNGSGVTNEYTNWSGWESNSRFIHSKYEGNPDAWERYNTTTKESLRKTPFVSLNSEFNKFLGDYNNRWYDNSNMPTQEIMHDLRAKSRSIYVDWEKRAAGTVTVTYTTKVTDPVNTKELTFGMGIYQELNKQQYARVETVKLPVLYQLNELFEPKVPERTPVDNLTALSAKEVNEIKTKILDANKNNKNELLSTNKLFKENLKDGENSIVINPANGDATITYKDDSTDTIKGSELVYEKPKTVKDDSSSAELKTDGIQNIKYYIKPVPVKNYNSITKEERDKALDSFLHENFNETGYNSYKKGIQYFLKGYFKPGVELNVGTNSVQIKFDSNDNLIVERAYKKTTLAIIPKEDLFLQPTFDVDAARTEAKKIIDSLDNLYPGEKEGYKNELNGKNTREEIERVLNNAQSKANENAVELAKMKKAANDKINALGYLTQAEKEEAIAKINTATIKPNDDVDKVSDTKHPDTDANRNETKARLDSFVDTLVKKDLAKAKEEAVKIINKISDENLPKEEKDKYNGKINNATEVGTVLNIVKEAQEAASAKEAERKKAEAEKVREQYKEMINKILDLTEEEKEEYRKEIDKATTTDEMNAIVEFAKLTGERKKAKSAIDELEYLNNNQKQSFKDLVDNSANKEDIENYVSQAKQLNSKMKQLRDLDVEARKIKPENGTAQDKYTKASADKQTAFDNALEKAERVLNKETGADEAITGVEKLFKELETAINELKPGENVTVNVDKSLLREEYDKGDSVKKSPAYTNETDETKKKAYDDALDNAKRVLDDTEAKQDAVDKALEALEKAKSGLNGKETEFELEKTNSDPVPISVEPAVGTVVLKPEDQKRIKDKIVGIPDKATVIYKPIIEKNKKFYVPVTVTQGNVTKTIEIEVVKGEVLNKPTTKVKVNDINKLTEDEKNKVKKAVKEANTNLTDERITVDGTGKVTVTYESEPSKTIEGTETVEPGIASKVNPRVTTAKISEVPQENGTITKEADVQKIKDAVTVTVPTDQPQDVTKELADGGKVVQGTNQSADGGADNTNKLVVKVKVTYKDESEDVVEVPVEASDDMKAQEEANKVKDEYKKKIDKISGLTDEQKNDYNKQIEDAKSTNQLDDILKKAESVGTINNLIHLNDAQKADLIDRVTKAADKDTVNAIVEEARALDNKMASLQQLVTKANGVKNTDKYNNATEGTKTPFDTALKNADDVAKKAGTKASVNEVNNLIDKLKEAIKNLTKEALQVEVNKEMEVHKSTAYSNAEKTKKDEYDKVLNEAKTVLNDKDAEQDNLDAALDKLEKARTDLNGKATMFSLKLKDNDPAKISKVPAVGEELTSKEDQDAVKSKVKVTKDETEGEVLDDEVTYGAIISKDDKFYVPVTVTRDGKSETINVEVVKKSDSTGGQGNQEGSGSQGDQNGQGESGSQNDQTGQGGTGSQGDQTGQGGTGSQGDQTGQGGTGSQGDQNGQGGTGSQGDQNGQGGVGSQGDQTGQGGAGSQGDQNGQGGEGSQGNQNGQGGEGSQGNQNGQGGEDSQGDQNGQGGSNSKPEDSSKLEKAKENAKSDLTEAADKEKGEIDADDKLSKDEKDKAKAKVDEVKKEQESNIDKAQTTDEVKEAVEKGKKAIGEVHKTELEKAKENAKSDLAQAAAKEKAEIEADNTLTEEQKKTANEKVDEVKKEHEANIDKAQTTDEVKAAVEKGKKAIDAVHQITPDQAKADLTDAANKEKGEISGDTTLTDKQKEDLKAKVDELKKAAEDKINNAKTPEEITKVVEEGKKAIADVYTPRFEKGEALVQPELPELSYQDALVAGKVAVEKGKELKADDILKQLTLVKGVTAKVTYTPPTTETGTKEAEVEITLADGSKTTVKVPVVVYEGKRPDVNDLAKAKEDAKKVVEDAAKSKIDEINTSDLSDADKKAAIDKVNEAKEDANKQIENATSAGTAKAIGNEAAENIKKFDPKATPDKGVKPVDPSELDAEKAKAIAAIEQAAKNQIDAIKNNKDLTPSQKEEAIKKIEDLKANAIENVRKAESVDKVKEIVKNVETAIKKVNPQPQPGNNSGNAGNNTGNTSNQNAQANSDALANARKAAENILDEAEKGKKAQLEEAGLSEAEKEELFAKVEAEKQAALDEIANAKDVEAVKQLVMKAVAKIKAIQPARNAQDNQGSQNAQNAQGAQSEQNGQDAQNYSNSNPTSLAAANGRGQELPATGTGSEFVVFNAAAISILTGLGLAIPSKKKETEK